MALLQLKQATFHYGDTPIVQNLDLDLEAGGIITIMGPSGCGKSTVLRLLSGLEHPQTGTCLLEGKPMDRPSPRLRYSFQDFDAFPWRTVRQNLLLSGAATQATDPGFQIDQLLHHIGLTGHEHKYPAELSGGMRKRLALGRCLAAKPQVILLDEPFSSLDVDSRQSMYNLLHTLWQEWHCLFVIITHDIHEAIHLSQRVIIAEKLPFRTKCTIPIPLPFPRTSDLASQPQYLPLYNAIHNAL